MVDKKDFTGKRIDGCEECENQESGACIECLHDQLEEERDRLHGS